MSTTVTGASGTTYITGAGTKGFDTAGLLKMAVEAKMQPAYRLDTQVKGLGEEVQGWQTALDDLTAVSDAAKALSSTATKSVFDERKAFLSSATIADVSRVMAATVDSDAALGIYAVKVVSIATTHKVSANEVADKSAALNLTGSFSLNQTEGTATPIAITADMSLEDISAAINKVSSDTGVTATLVKTSASGYTLVLASAGTGQSIVASDTSGDILAGLGVLDAGGAFVKEQPATLAQVEIDGVVVTSKTNDIEDVLPGVSISLYGDSAGGTITLEVGQDLESVATSVTDFVKAYNTYRALAVLNQSTDANGAVEGAVLFGDGLLRSTNTALYGVLGMSVDIEGKTYTLGSLGISYDKDNSLKVDSAALEEMLVQHPDVVQAFFQQSVASSNAGLYVAQTPGNLPGGDYTVAVTTDGSGTITGATIDGVAMDVDNLTLTGPKGTIYEGVRLVYTDKTSSTTTVSVKPGLADQMTGALKTYVSATDGLLSKKITSLNGVIDDKQTKRDRIAEQAVAYEEKMKSYYARIEAAIEASDLALKQLEAMLKANSDD